MAPRILLCGDVLGCLNALFKRVATVNKANGPFDALLCVGQFFPNHVEELDEMKQYVQGQKEIPLPTYFIGDFGEGVASVLSAAKLKSAEQGFKMEGIVVCNNLYWLKGSGKFIFHGLSIAYLAGRSSSSGSAVGVYSEDDIDALRAFAEESGIVDLFLTNEWPQGILGGANLANAPPGIEHLSGGNAVISELVKELKPRYHIAGCEGIFYAREPYTNDGASHVTRFLGLAAIGNDKKQKFIHALSPTPASVMSASELSAIPANATASPYNVLHQSGGAKDTKKRPEDSDSPYWRYDVSHKRHRGGTTDGEKICFQFLSSGSCSRGEKCNFRHDTDNKTPFSKGVCFDFISKGRCERGLDCKFRHSSEDGGGNDDQIHPGSCFDFFRKGRCDKGDDCRFSHDLDAGKKRGNAVSTTNQPCWFCLSSPNIDSHLVVSIGENIYCAIAKGPLVEGHLLIIPIEHLNSSFSLPQEADGELQKYKHALKRFFRKQGDSIVVFERYFNLRVATHAHLQVVPIPLSKASAVRSEFVSAGKKMGFEFDVIRPGKNDVDTKMSLKKLLHGGNGYFFVELPEGTILAHSIESGEKLPIQFGREVLASLLGKTDRSDWKDCKLSKEEERAMAEDFKNSFESFDPMISM